MPSSRRTAARASGVRPEARRVHAVRHRLDAIGARAERDRALAQIVAARRDPAGAREGRPRRAPGQRAALGDEDVRSVQADDERQRRPRERRHEAAGNHPVTVHDRRAILRWRRAGPRASRTASANGAASHAAPRTAVSARKPPA